MHFTSDRIEIDFALCFNPICTGKGQICPPPHSYFNIAPKLNESFALMYANFESNLITHFQKVWGQPDNRK